MNEQKQEKIGPDQVVNLIWIACIIGMILVLCLTNRQKPYFEVTGGSIIELAETGYIVREDVTVTWHGDTLCNPDELRVAGKRLIEMADKADRGDMRNAAKP